MNLNDLADFHLVAAHGGFSQASRLSGRPKATLSRTVAALEASLGVRLLERSSHHVRLTSEGEQLRARTAGFLSAVSEAASDLRDGSAVPRGTLRLHVPVLFGHMLMGRLAAHFTRAYPDVTLHITIADRAADLVAEGFDAEIRVSPRPDAELAGRCFARDQLLIVAAPDVPRPSAVAESCHGPVDIVVNSTVKNPPHWTLSGEPELRLRTRTVLSLPAFTLVRDAVLTGIGAARLPRLLVADDLAAGRLVCWAPTADPLPELWVRYPARPFVSAKVHALVDFLDRAFPDAWL